jgi:hypothetical protein
MKLARLLLVFLSTLCIGTAQETVTYLGRSLTEFPGPQVYKDPTTGTLLYVETDGRHEAAISVNGKLLWIRDPFKDAQLSFYRTKTPRIVYIGPIPKDDTVRVEHDKFVAIRFNSSQFGVMSISNGDFRFGGQD